MKIKLDDREYELDFGELDLDQHREVKGILGKTIRQAWAQLDWRDNEAVADFLNDPDVILALTWAALSSEDRTVTVKQAGALKFRSFEYVAAEMEEAASPPAEPAPPQKKNTSGSTESPSGGNGSGSLNPETNLASSGAQL